MVRTITVGHCVVGFYDFRDRKSEAEIERLVRRHAILIPTAVHELAIFYNLNMPDTDDASARIDDEYRTAQICISSHMFNPGRTHQSREESFVHELFHLSINPLPDFCISAIERLMPDAPKYFAELKEGIRRRTESSVVDVTRAYLATVRR